jgi:hypothetical protein
MNEHSFRLARLGDELERAAAADLAAGRRRRISPRALALAAAIAVVLGSGIAVAAVQLTSPSSVAHSLPAGTAALLGTHPVCTVVEQGVEYRCTLARPPAPEVSDWKGTVEPTVDATKHVNGGCRSLASDGLTWTCYLGHAAVEERIISADFLGEYAPAPGHG